VRRLQIQLKHLRDKSKFASGFSAESRVQSQALKYSDSGFQKNMIVSLRPAPTRGALRDRHECRVRDAMDAKYRQTCDIDADGKVVWSWHPWAGAKFAVTNRERR
jgi:hypothetical protein